MTAEHSIGHQVFLILMIYVLFNVTAIRGGAGLCLAYGLFCAGRRAINMQFTHFSIHPGR